MSELVMWPKVVFFGDSLTERAFESTAGFWGSIIADKLKRVCDVVTRGFSGYNTSQCLKILPKIYNSTNVQDIVAFFICLGANDCSLPNHKQHIPLEEYAANLQKMIDYLVSIGIPKNKIILLTCPPYYIEEHVKENANARSERCVENAEKYTKACLELGKKCGVEAVDIYHPFLNNENPLELFVDGLHFSQKGAYLMAETVWPSVEARTKSIDFKFPLWRDFDLNDF